jgi:hypothetical protein
MRMSLRVTGAGQIICEWAAAIPALRVERA